MMRSIMLVDRLPLITREKLNHRMGTLFYKKVVLSKQRFYENLGRVLPDPSEISKTELLWRSKGFEERLL
jgi:lauroyl/myristoyl acyltransferase